MKDNEKTKIKINQGRKKRTTSSPSIPLSTQKNKIGKPGESGAGQDVLQFTQFVVDNMSDAVYWAASSGELVYVNNAACQKLGYTRSELLSMQITDIVPDYSREGWSSHFRSLKQKGTLVLESQHKMKNGAVFPVEVRTNFVNYKNKKYACGIAHDITERKQSEEKLRETQNFLTVMMENAPMSIYATSADGRLLLVNRAWEASRHILRKEAIGSHLDEIFSYEMARRLDQDNLRVIETAAPLEIEEAVDDPDGRHYYHTVKFPLGGAANRVESVGGISIDITERKQAEEKLLESEARYRLLVDRLNEGLYIIDNNGVITFANHALARMLGFENPDDIIGKNFIEFVPSDKDNSLLHQYRAAMLGEPASKIIVTEIIRADGERGYLEIKPQVIYEDGKPAGDSGIVYDITERRQAEDRLLESEERYRDLVENSHELIYTHDLRGQILSVNHTAVLGLGYTTTSLVGRNLAEMLIPEELNQFEGYLGRIRRKASDAGIWTLQSMTGEKRIWEYHSTMRSGTRQGPYVRGMAHDITDRMHAEHALRESEERFHKIFDEGLTGMVLTSSDMGVFAANAAFCRMLGYNADEMTSKTFLDVTHPEHREQDRKNVEKLWRGEIPQYRTEKRYIAKNGVIRWGNLSTSLIRGHDGKPQYALAMVEDVTDRKQAEEELRESEARYRSLFENSVMGISLAKPDGHLIGANHAYARMYGYENPETMIEEVSDIGKQLYTKPEDRAEMLQILQEHGVMEPRELDVRRRDGTQFTVLSGAREIKDSAGNLVGYQTEHIDITERKRATQRQEIIYQVLRAVSGQLNIDLVAQSAADTLERITAYPHICLALPEEDGKHWVVHGAAGRLAAEVGGTYPIHQGVIGRAFKTGQSQWVRDNRDDPGYVRDVNKADTPELRSEIVSLLRSGDEVFGALNVESELVDAFDDEDAAMIQSLADVIALAVENAKLYLEAQKEISERKQAEEKLRESESFNQALISHSPIGVSVRTPTGQLLYTNDAWKKIWAIPGPAVSEDLSRKRDTLIFDERDGYLRSFQEDIRKVYQEGGQLNLPNLKTSSTRPEAAEWVSQYFYALQDESGAVNRVVVLTEDITERKRVEEDLRESEEKWRLLVKTIPDYIAIHDQNGKYLFLNHYADGFSEKDVIGRSLYDFLPPDSRQIFKENLNEIKKNGEMRRFEYTAMGDHGEMKEYEEYLVPLKGSGGKTDVLAIARDISERKRGEEAIRRRNAELTALNQIGQALSRLAEPSEILEIIFVVMGQVLDNSNLFIALYDQDSQYVSFPVYTINGERIFGGDRPLGNGITDYVIRSNQPFLVRQNLEKALDQRGIELIGTPSQSFLAVPMRRGEKVIGVIALQDYENENAYDEQQLELLTTMAAQATTALENARLYGAVRKELEERRRAEEGVRENEYRYRAVFDGVDDAIFIESLHGSILDANRRACEMFGYNHDEFLTKKVIDLVPSREYIVSFNPKDSATLPIHPFETVNVRANGEQFPIELNIRMQTFNGEQVLFVVGRDVSERKRVQELLQESEARFKMMFEQAPLAINITRGTDIIYANPAYLEMFRYTDLEELQTLPPLGLFTPEFRPVILENIRRRSLGLPVPNGYEADCLRKDGTRISVLMDFARISFVDGPATVGFILDITDRKRAETALHDSEERFKQIAEQTEEWIWEVDAKGLYTISSPIVEKILGFSPNELVGKKHFYDLFAPDQREGLREAAFEAFSRKESIKGLINENVHKDGRIVILETNGIPVVDAAGTLHGYRGADKDITERKRAEKELANSREQLRALSRYLQAAREEERTFIAREIHDELGQELTALKMDLAWFTKQLPQEQTLLIQKADAMSNMVDGTIQTVRRVASQLRPGMLDDLGLVAALEWQAGEFQSRTGITCKLDLPENIPMPGKDQSTAIFRIFQEALTNIGRHAHATKVRISLKEQPDGIDLVVHDNGIGITQDQLNDPRSLGLTGMRERIQAFGGTLQFKSVKGRGTSVRLRMPLSTKQREKEA